MRKRTVIGIILLFVAVSLAFLSVSVTKMIRDDITAGVDEAETYILEGNREKAMETAQRLSSNWERQYKILSAYISHDHLERCGVAIGAVMNYLSLEDSAAALVMCQDIRVSAEHIYASERPELSNIF